MINIVNYEVNLYLNGNRIGDCRSLAQNLSYARKRTKIGADSIDFTINDVLFDRWCQERNYTINDLLKPLALECRIVRNGIELVGGFLATMPGYSPRQASADLSMRFDGFLNLLNGVYIRSARTGLPRGAMTGRMGDLVVSMVNFANSMSSNAGKGYGFNAGHIDRLATVTHTFDNYKTVKSWICDRCDNTTGAGPFDVYFHADKTYDIYADNNFGDVITDWVAFYPTMLNNTSITSISAAEVEDFASAIVGVGAGDISSVPQENTAIVEFNTEGTSVAEYGYYEAMYQNSSVSSRTVLSRNMLAELWNKSNPIWKPEITLHGKQVEPKPTGDNKIWIGDTITINNSADLTGMTNGDFRVNELAVRVSSANDETITPVLERV